MDKNLNDINNEKKLNVQEEQIKDAAEGTAGSVPDDENANAENNESAETANNLNQDAADEASGKKKGKLNGFKRGIALGAAAVLILEAGALKFINSGDYIDFIKVDKKLKEIESLINYTYLYDADKQKMEDGMFTGLVYGLTDDQYSAYYSKSVFDEEKKRLNGNYVGIGVTITKDPETGGILVNAVNGEGPAAKVGIQPGDIIIKADGNDLTQKDADFAVSLITGEVGTTVNITLLRDGKELEFTVERANITTISVQSDVLDEGNIADSIAPDPKNSIKGTNIGYISINTFNQTTMQEFVDELDDLAEDKQVDGIVIDLRNNGGGDMNICLEMLDMILPDDLEPVVTVEDGETSETAADEEEAGLELTDNNGKTSDKTDKNEKIKDNKYSLGKNLTPEGDETDETGTLLLSIENKIGEADKYYAADGWGNDVPIVVVVNENSASASEIFAGVLRDYGYQIVGEKTFGKGIVQSLYPLSDGSAVKFTTQQYRLPGGELIHGKGITPTIEVPFEEYDGVTAETVNYANGAAQPDIMKDKQIAAAVKELERQVYEAYQNQ